MTPTGGGVYSVTYNIHTYLERNFNSICFLQITPEIGWLNSLWSKFNRKLLHRRGSFFSFSEKTLEKTWNQVYQKVPKEIDALLFRSSTRWIRCRPSVPYFVHTDVVFKTFFDNTFAYSDFIESDIRRICEQEAGFLDKARAVFFESQWGLERAKTSYGLSGTNFFVTTNGGNIAPPPRDCWDGDSLKLITIAKDFYQKGGDIVLDAFVSLKPKHQNLEWHIIGGKPLVEVDSIPGISWEGFLRPTIPTEMTRFTRLLEQAFLLIHPTREDANPLVLIEAGYFGCPSISVNDFAIPELVKNNETGYLIDRPITSEAVARSIDLAIHSSNYRLMRESARIYATTHFCWENTGKFIANVIKSCL